MRRLRGPMVTVFLVVVMTSTSCGDAASSPADDTASALASAAVQLVTVDNTFGGGDVFSDFFVKPNTDPTAGATNTGGVERPLTDEERRAIEEALSPHGRVHWLDGSDEPPTTAGEMSATIGLGEPQLGDITGFVAVSLVCGSLCGTWFTYEMAYQLSSWVPIGIEGPIAIS